MKIGYVETFPLLGSGRWEKIPLETETDVNIQLDSTDEEIEEIMKKVRRIQYAFKKQVQSFFYESNAAAEKQMGTRVTDVTDNPVIDEQINSDLEHCKMMLSKHSFMEDAQEYLNDTGFKFNLECKAIVYNLPSKNDKK